MTDGDNMRSLCIVVALAFVAIVPRPIAQSPESFTTEDMLKVASISVLDLSEDGRRVAAAVRRLQDNAETDHRRFGDPTYVAPTMVELLVIDTQSGAIERPFPQLMNVRQAAWTRDGTRLALLTTSQTRDQLPVTTAWIWDPERRARAEVPQKAAIAANSELTWLPDGSALLVALRDAADDRAARASFDTLLNGPIVVHTSKDPFLEWDALRRADRLRSLARLNPATGDVSSVLPAARVTNYQLSRDGTVVTFLEDATEKTDYDVISGTQNNVKLVDVSSAASPRMLADSKTIKTTTPRWSEDGRVIVWAEKGEIFVQRVDETKPRSLTPKPSDSKETESFSIGPFSRDASKMVLTSSKGWYVVDLAAASRERIFTLDDKDEAKNPRISVLDWTPAGDALLLQYGERDRWDRGVARLEINTKQLTTLVKDRNLYQNIRFSRDGRTVVYQMSDGDRPAELFAADASFRNARKLTDLNPWLARKALPTSELVAYRDADGKQLHGVLRYPVGYQKGHRYPTVFEIYETFFENGFNARATLLANRGYAVFHPSVNLVVGRPGESWTKGVTSAANRLIDLGIADPDRLGVHGTSYGGYATVLLITGTDRFKAAINISGKVDMVSFYTDSPRLGVRNTHAPEKSQDRIGGTLWEYPERYLEHSAVLRADRIKTPLLNITGDQDPNVPSSQSREIYYALRRLGREVEWVRYVNGGHRPPNSVSETIDFENRIVAWYDKYLKAEPKTTTSQ